MHDSQSPYCRCPACAEIIRLSAEADRRAELDARQPTDITSSGLAAKMLAVFADLGWTTQRPTVRLVENSIELLVVVAHDSDEHEIRKMIPAGLPDDVIALIVKGLLYENDWAGVAYETFIGGVRQ